MRSLHEILVPGGQYFMLCFSDLQPGEAGGDGSAKPKSRQVLPMAGRLIQSLNRPSRSPSIQTVHVLGSWASRAFEPPASPLPDPKVSAASPHPQVGRAAPSGLEHLLCGHDGHDAVMATRSGVWASSTG